MTQVPACAAQLSSASPGAEKKKDAAAQAPQGPTIIDSDAMDYDGKTRIAIFTGDELRSLRQGPFLYRQLR